MFRTYWLALGAFAMVMMLLWMFAPRDRTYLTSVLAFGAWAIMAFTAETLETVSSGAIVAAPASREVALFCGVLAALSGVVGVLYHFDHYPPEKSQT